MKKYSNSARAILLRKPTKITVALMGCAWLCFSCSDHPAQKQETKSAKVSSDTATTLAIREFSKSRSLDLTNYFIRVVGHENSWHIWFEPIGDNAVPGGNRLITVDRDTGDVKQADSL